MPVFLLRHQHDEQECPAAFAAWTGTTAGIAAAIAVAGALIAVALLPSRPRTDTPAPAGALPQAAAA